MLSIMLKKKKKKRALTHCKKTYTSDKKNKCPNYVRISLAFIMFIPKKYIYTQRK